MSDSVSAFIKWLLTQVLLGIYSVFGVRTYEHKDYACDYLLEPLGDLVSGEREFKQLIRQHIIENFHFQRQTGSQFAVLLIMDGKKPGNRLTFSPCDGNRKPLYDSSHIFYPPPTEYVNYIVARPSIKPHRIVRLLYLSLARSNHYQTHAEEVLLSEFGSQVLVESFKETNHSCPNTIVLFSWLFPCTICTDLIIEKWTGASFHQKYPTVQNIILAYKTYWRRVSKEENEKNIVRLRQEGFKLVRVDYERQLPPLHLSKHSQH